MPEVIALAIPIDVFIVAILALITLYATRPLIQFVLVGVANAVSNVPGIGNSAASAIINAEESVYSAINNQLASWWNDATRPFTNFADTVAGNFRTLWYTIDQHRTALNLALSAIVSSVTNQGASFASDLVQTNLSSVEQWAAGAIGKAESDVIDWTKTYVGDVETWASSQFHTLSVSVQNLAGTLTADVSTLSSGIASAEHNAEDYAQTLYTEATTYARDIVVGAEQVLTEAIDSSYNRAAAAISAAESWTEGRLVDLDNKYANTTNILATLIMQNAIPRIAAIEQDVTNCLKPMCDVGPNFMQGLSGVLNLLETGALYGLLAALVADPEAAGQALVETVSTVESVALAGLNTITGASIGS